jgi:hypothetical protein
VTTEPTLTTTDGVTVREGDTVYSRCGYKKKVERSKVSGVLAVDFNTKPTGIYSTKRAALVAELEVLSREQKQLARRLKALEKRLEKEP